MSGYLLDTNVISMFAPGKPSISPVLSAWMIERGVEGALFISAITIAEIEQGIRKLVRKGSPARAGQLQSWMDDILAQFADRILPIDATVGRIIGEMSDRAEGMGANPGLADIAIAATAAAHGLIVVTLNKRHFEPLAVAVELPVS